jgi:hypothetical protein
VYIFITRSFGHRFTFTGGSGIGFIFSGLAVLISYVTYVLVVMEIIFLIISFRTR